MEHDLYSGTSDRIYCNCGITKKKAKETIIKYHVYSSYADDPPLAKATFESCRHCFGF